MAKLVVVDNDSAVLDLLTLDLRLEGHEILGTAADGVTALRACTDLKPDVLVVDLRMGPGIDGLDVAERVRATVPRIVLHTNYVNPTVVERATSLGVTVVEKGSLRALRRAIEGASAA